MTMRGEDDLRLYADPKEICPYCQGPIGISGRCDNHTPSKEGVVHRASDGLIRVWTKVELPTEEVRAAKQIEAKRWFGQWNDPEALAPGVLVCPACGEGYRFPGSDTAGLRLAGLCAHCEAEFDHDSSRSVFYRYKTRRPSLREVLAVPTEQMGKWDIEVVKIAMVVARDKGLLPDK